MEDEHGRGDKGEWRRKNGRKIYMRLYMHGYWVRNRWKAGVR
jgi:hypothetical protein